MTQKNPLEAKKLFSEITSQLEREFKTNNMAYKEKYYELASFLNCLYKDVKKCHEKITRSPIEENSSPEQEEMKMISQSKLDECQLDPISLVEYIQEICEIIALFCGTFFARERALKEEISELFKMGTNSNFLEVLALKDLENYDLKIQVETLETTLLIKAAECKLASKATLEYQKKFKEYEKDYDCVMISAANLLKESENYEIELRQENRLQKELLQSHRIEFEKFKSDFKLKPSYTEKLKKITQIMEKKYQDREILIVKQTDKIVEQRIRHEIRHN